MIKFEYSGNNSLKCHHKCKHLSHLLLLWINLVSLLLNLSNKNTIRVRITMNLSMIRMRKVIKIMMKSIKVMKSRKWKISRSLCFGNINFIPFYKDSSLSSKRYNGSAPNSTTLITSSRMLILRKNGTKPKITMKILWSNFSNFHNNLRGLLMKMPT